MVGYYGQHLADPFSIFKMLSSISRHRDNLHRRLSLQRIGTQKEKDWIKLDDTGEKKKIAWHHKTHLAVS